MNKKIITTDPEAYAPALDVMREKITVLAARGETGGYEVFLHRGDDGIGPPPHTHEWDESFFVIRGEVRFEVGGRSVLAKAGTFLHVPAGTVHCFRYGLGGAEVLGVTGVNSAASELFAQLDQEIVENPPEIPRVVAILERHGAALAV